MKANWNDNIFNCLHLVNSKLHGFCPLPEKASALLSGMESCLCSGDGLSDRTAFKAGCAVVVDRTLNLLGMGGSIRRIEQEDGTTIVSLSENPYGIGKLYFKI